LGLGVSQFVHLQVSSRSVTHHGRDVVHGDCDEPRRRKWLTWR
jgi:hypothetical protein